MAESARKVARHAEDRLAKVAENVRERFDRMTEGRFTDKIQEGHFVDRADGATDNARADERGKRGGSTS